MTPLLAATLAYAAGMLAGLRWAAPAWLLVAAAALLCVVSLRRKAVRRCTEPRRPPALRAGGTAILAAFFAAGVLVGGARGASTRDDCRARLPDGAAVRAVGVPASLPVEGAALAFRAYRLDAAGGSCRGSIRLRAHARHVAALDSSARGIRPRVEVHGRWTAYPRRGGWPRHAAYAGALLVDSVMAAPAGAHAGARAGTATHLRVMQQARLRALLPERWPLAEALLLAQKSGLDRETRSRWVAAGLVHLLAISGMHVGLIAAGVLGLASAAGLPARRARRLALGLTAAYVLFLGAPTAALRALLQAALLLASLELQRPAHPFTILATAALIILVLEPMALLDPGFQLSFAGMVGLMAWRRPFGEVLPGVVPGRIRDGLAAGLAASALTTPIAALHFGQAAWIGIPGSIAAVPVLAAAVAVLVVALLVAATTGSTAGFHAAAADLTLQVLDAVAELCARVPGGHGHLSSITVLALLAAAAAALLVRARMAPPASMAEPPAFDAPDAVHASYARRHRHRRLRNMAAAAAAIAVIAWAPLLRPQDGSLAIHAIDVGQGDAFAVRTPRGRWILVDAGPRTMHADAGRDRVVPFLLRSGTRRVDVLILTHPDADHIGGAAAVLDAFDVGLVIDPGVPAGKDMFIDLIAAARRGAQRWIAAREGIRFDVDGVTFSILHPFRQVDGTVIANDLSVVLRMEYGPFAALFLGDAPEAVEEMLVARHGEALRAEVLKVGHHGSATSTGEALLASTRPAIALVSAGRRNRYGHPAPGVLRRLARHEVRVLRTDELGNITVRVTPAGKLEVRAR
jgi:competence protein ComEC